MPIINLFRGLLVIGNPGSGKSYFIIRISSLKADEYGSLYKGKIRKRSKALCSNGDVFRMVGTLNKVSLTYIT